MALGGQWLRRGPVPACAAAPAPRPLPYPPPPTPALPPGAGGGHFLQFLCVTCRGAQSSHRTPTHTLPQNRNDLGWGGWEDARGGGICNKLHSEPGRGGCPAAFYSGSANAAVRRPSPPPPEGFQVLEASGLRVSKRVLPPAKGRRGNSAGERQRFTLLTFAACVCVCVCVPPRPRPLTRNPRLPPPQEPRSPPSSRRLLGAAARPRWPQPAQCSPAYPPGPAAAPPTPSQEPPHRLPPPRPLPGLQPPPPPGSPNPPRPRRKAAAEGSGGTAWGRRAGRARSAPAAEKKKPLGLRGKGGRTDPTRPDPAGRQGRTGGQFYP